MNFIYFALAISIPALPGLAVGFCISCILCSKKAFPHLLSLQVYSISILLLILLGVTSYYRSDLPSLFAFVNVFLIIEYIVVFSYIRQHVRWDTGSRVLLFFQQMFPLACGYIWLYNNAMNEFNPVLFGIHHLLIFVACLIFYQQMIFNSQVKILFKHPPLWIVAGIMTSCLISHSSGFMFNTGLERSYIPMGILLAISAYLLLFLAFFIALNFYLKS